MSPARHRRVQVGPVLGLTAVWVLLWGNPSWANVLGGAVVAVAVLVVFPLPALTTGVRLRPVPVVVLVARFAVDVVRSSFHVAWTALRPGSLPRSSVVTTQLTTDNQLVQMVVAQILTLVPGSIVVELDPSSKELSMHVLGASRPADVDRTHAEVRDLERRVLHAFGLADTAGGSLFRTTGVRP